MDKAENTRMSILDKAFTMIYQNGYQATSIDKIIDTTQVTKGAFYYHFKNKDEMGVAVINEIILPKLNKSLLSSLQNSNNPIEDIYSSIEKKLLNDNKFDIDFGCPTNNLVQEMSPININFNKALKKLLDNWMITIENTLEQGKLNGSVNLKVNSKETAQFIVASYEGLKGLGKIYGKTLYVNYLAQLKQYLNTIK